MPVCYDKAVHDILKQYRGDNSPDAKDAVLTFLARQQELFTANNIMAGATIGWEMIRYELRQGEYVDPYVGSGEGWEIVDGDTFLANMMSTLRTFKVLEPEDDATKGAMHFHDENDTLVGIANYAMGGMGEAIFTYILKQ